MKSTTMVLPIAAHGDAASLALIEPLFAAATGDASVAMSRWSGGLVTMELDQLRELPLEEICEQLDVGGDPLTMVVLSLEGEPGGDMILTFDEASGRRLAAALLSRPVSDAPEWSELEKSALMETGNILGCAYMNALTRHVDVRLVPAPPQFVQDFGASVLEHALTTQAIASDTALLGRTRFELQGMRLAWNVYFVPSQALRQALAGAARS
jgi:chemotaxis protein CheC